MIQSQAEINPVVDHVHTLDMAFFHKVIFRVCTGVYGFLDVTTWPCNRSVSFEHQIPQSVIILPAHGIPTVIVNETGAEFAIIAFSPKILVCLRVGVHDQKLR